MKISRGRKILLACLFAAVLLGLIFVWNIGGVLMAPSNRPVGNAPAQLAAEPVVFPSASGADLHGWFIAGRPGGAAVILLHGIHADRRVMLARAEWLARQGFSVLLFDFQAHGESAGKHITFGHLESRDATAAVDFLHRKAPGEKIGVIGVSLGAAAALLAEPPLPIQALVLESCFPTIYEATDDRMQDRFGWVGKLGTPLLIGQLKPRLGISPNELKPINQAKRISAPKFFIAGTTDRLTTLAESEALFAAAAEPKQCWWVDGAAHVDLHAFTGAEYERRVGNFLEMHLRPPGRSE